MGALDFVSPGAQAVAAFVFKSPSLVFDDILAVAAAHGPEAGRELAELESRLELRLREDVAETLGGEFALALDGPILPIPAWKFVIEVYDPARLQSSIELFVRKAGDEAARSSRPALSLDGEQVADRTYYTLHGGGLPSEVHYAWAEGYLVAAPSRALVMRAIETRRSGETLGQSASLRALFARDGAAHVSGLLYQNLGPMLGSLLEAPGADRIAPDQRRSLDDLARGARPSLLSAYGEEGGIRVAASGGLFDLDASELALPLLLRRALPGARDANGGPSGR
jgi:hypothetical protein